MAKHKNCLVCGSEHLNQLQGYYEKHEMVKCGSCGFVFMENIPTLEELTDYYEKYSYAQDAYLSPLTVKSYQTLLDEFEPYRKNNRILDVGCGRGWFLEEAKKRGWEVYGTEYSDEAIKLCRSNGLNMEAGKITPEMFEEGFFDIVTSFEVIEHINNPVEETTNIYNYLRKGGLFYCTTPNFNAYLRHKLKSDYNVILYPEHLSYYTKKTLNKLLRDRGFEKKKILTTGISITRSKPNTNQEVKEIVTETSSDEKLRQQIASKWYLGYAKNLANFVLSATGIGMSLKGYFVKP